MLTKAAKLRELFQKPSFFRLIGAHNGLTARLGERAGFDGIWASSLEVSASHAVPDANILTMTDYLNAAIDMNEAVSIPVVADIDQGYGNSINVIRAIRKFEEAGIAGVIMEDKLFPKQNSLLSDGKQELAPIAEFVGKIMAAKNSQKTKEFMVMARVEALIAGWGHEEAMKRAKAYVEAGADAIMIHSKNKDPANIIKFIEGWKEKIPLVIVPTSYYTFTEDKIKDYPQIKMVIYANQGIRTIVKSVSETFNEIIKAGGGHTVVPKISSVREVFELQDTFKMKEDEEKFVKCDKEVVKAVIPAAGDDSLKIDLKDLLQDRPLTMLDVCGKPILQRISETLTQCGIRRINVVGGYKIDKINIENIRLINNKEYSKTRVLSSVMKGIEDIDDKTLMAYGDILFEKHIIERLLNSKGDITLVIDRSYVHSPNLAKKLDLVITKIPPAKGHRILSSEKENPILKIGKNIEGATHEFVGIALFSKKGVRLLKETYSNIKNKEGKFHEAESVAQADFMDLIQELIDNGIKIDSLEIDRGWMEINTFENYKKSCGMLAE